jgi:hypothetical protein
MGKYLAVFIATLSLWTGAVQAIPIVYTASLSGLAESPPNASPATGFATVTYDSSAHTLLVDMDFQDLLADTIAAHIHCCALPGDIAGVATQLPTFVGFPLGVTAGTYLNLFDLTLTSSFNAAFISASGGTAAGAEAVLANGLANGEAYFNIHTTLFRGGEIRGNLAAVPEPTVLALLGLGLGTLIACRRKRRGAAAGHDHMAVNMERNLSKEYNRS